MRMEAEAKRLYPVLCAWCELHGRKPVVIGMSEGSESHGICKECQKELLKEVMADRKANNGISADRSF